MSAPRHSGKGAPYVSPMLKDPNISHGRFKVLPQADGKFAVYDPERPFGDRTVTTRSDAKAAGNAAKKLHEAEVAAAAAAKQKEEAEHDDGEGEREEFHDVGDGG